jgi:hypothetical protein
VNFSSLPLNIFLSSNIRIYKPSCLPPHLWGYGRWLSEELHNFDSVIILHIIKAIYSSSIRWAKHVAHRRQVRNSYKILTVEPEGSGSLRRLMHKLENNIKVDHKNGVWGYGLDVSAWAQSPVAALVNRPWSSAFHKRGEGIPWPDQRQSFSHQGLFSME